MLSFSITPIQKMQSFVTWILKVPFKKKKKGIRNLYFFLSFLSLYLLLDLLVGLTLEEKQEEKI